jgi:uncharacterized OsmC-like protein
MERPPDILGRDSRPAYFPVGNAADIGLNPPADRLGVGVRTWVRALAGMQKEAIIVNGATGRSWRLVSDEGPYLAGHDRAPCPLCTFITGMVSAYMNEITAAASDRGLDIDDIELTLSNHYSMEGSALQGTMLGGAMSPELEVDIAADADAREVEALVQAAVVSSPVNGLVSGEDHSLFTLSWNGSQVPVGEVGALDGAMPPDPASRFDEVEIADIPVATVLMTKVRPADQVEGVPGGKNSSLQDSQSRTLHVGAHCRLREDGVKVIDQNLIRPIGSGFQFLCDEAAEAGGQGLAPDAATYLSAGIGFCFMTQFGRYASITKKRLDEYRIIQDTHFSSRRDGAPGETDPVETHVYLVTPEGEAFARKTLDMGERTCFLHATCRTALTPKVTVNTPGAVSRP